MNKGFIGIVLLVVVAILAATFVLTKKDSEVNKTLFFYELIPTNFTNEILEIKKPYQVVEELLTSSLIWKELDENQTQLENFWNSTDSQFNSIKEKAEAFYLFSTDKSNYFLFELGTNLDSINAKEGYSAYLFHNFLLYSTSNLSEFHTKYEEEASLIEHHSFERILNQKTTNKEGIKLYQKKIEEWNVHEITFLPEQVFSSSNVKRQQSRSSFSGKLDLTIFDYLPARFHAIEITQKDTLVVTQADSVYYADISKKCDCDALFSLTNWRQHSQIKFVPFEDSNEIMLVKLTDLSDFEDAMKDLMPDSIFFQEGNHQINYLGEGIKIGSFQKNYTYVLRIDDYVYFGEEKSQLEKMDFRVFSGLTVSSSEEVSTFINHNISRSSFYIAITQGLKLGVVESKKGLSLYQEKNQTEDLNYVSFIYSQEIEIGKGMVNPKWIKSFDTRLTNRIYKVENHRTNDHNYLVQDENNVIYFVSPNGEINWSKGIEGEIVGNVKNIDLFGNQKKQLIFNTSNQLFLLDILGRNVGDFPVVIKDSAIANVSVMDYDKDLNFRFLVPTMAGIKSVNTQGELVKGWAQPKTKSSVVGDIAHLLISSLDYILVQDNTHNLYFLNRRGEERHKVSARFGTPFMVTKGSSINSTRALYFDSIENTICRQFFSDKPVSILLSPQKKITQFFFVDFDQDEEKDFVLIFGNELVVYGQDLIIKEKIELPEIYSQLRVREGEVSYINALNDLVITRKGKNHLIERVEYYELDKVKNRLRVLVKSGNNLKLLHLQ